jgi:hypothetical protein
MLCLMGKNLWCRAGECTECTGKLSYEFIFTFKNEVVKHFFCLVRALIFSLCLQIFIEYLFTCGLIALLHVN